MGGGNESCRAGRFPQGGRPAADGLVVRTRAWWIFLAAGAVAIGAYLLMPAGWPQLWMDAAIGLSGAAAIAVGALWHRPRSVSVWWFLAIGLLFESLGDPIYSYQVLAFDAADPFPSVADLPYLLGALFIAIGLVRLIRARTGWDRPGLIDATVVAAGTGLLAWVFVMAPAAGDTHLTLLGQVVSLAYPIWDVLFLAILVRLLAGAGVRVPALRLLAAASMMWLAMDVAYAVLLHSGTYSQGDYVSVLWILGFVTFGAAALHPSMAELAQPAGSRAPRFTRRRLVSLTSVSLIAPMLLLCQTALSDGQVDGVAIGIASAVLFILVVLRMAGLVRQVEEQAAQLSVLARNDSLTGVPNRRSWEIELPVAIDRARRDGNPLSVALIDLDHFKRFNDEYGHQAGDRLLRAATAAWTTALRSTDILCRYGGEEFSVLLPDSTPAEATEVLERLRAATPLAQTFSAGVTCWDGQESSDELVGRADRGMYAAKDAGRDRILTDGRPTVVPIAS